MVDRKRYDIAASEDNPLDYATARRDSDVLSYLRTALEEKTALLAYQPIVASRGSQGAVFYEGLIHIPDPTGRIIPARDFVFLAEETELGRQIDCSALYLGLGELTKYPVCDCRLICPRAPLGMVNAWIFWDAPHAAILRLRIV